MALSPMMEHYLKMKDKYKDCIVFYRLGDFYEMFFDDAIKVSKMLDLTLTGRDCGLKERAPMCGIPYHAADVYISKLVSFGEKVAICEQLSEAGGKDLVVRDVIKVVTAGTVTNDEYINEKTNNFLGCVYINNDVADFSYVDITTGEFFVTEYSGDKYLQNLTDNIIKIAPSEIIANNKASEIFAFSPVVEHGVIVKFNNYLESEFNYNIAERNLKEQFEVSSLLPFSLDKEGLISSAGALVSYIKETQKHSLINIKSIRKIDNKGIMLLDSNAVRNLELIKTLKDGKRYGSLLWLLDKTKTSMGARKLNSYILSPLKDKDKIEERLDAVDAFFKNTLIRESVGELLSSVKDVGRIAGKIANLNLMPKDCLSLLYSLEVLPSVKFQLSGLSSSLIAKISNDIVDYTDIEKLLSSSIESDNTPNNMKDGGYIKKGFNSQLDELRSIGKNAKSLLAELEAREREKTGIKTLKVGYNRVFGYFIELTNSVKNLAPYNYVRRQTLAGSERFVTEELKELENKILNSEEQALKLESEIYREIVKKLESRMADFLITSEAIADLDVLISLATVARENNYNKPIITLDGELSIVNGRHPVVEKISKQKFVANDTFLNTTTDRTIILTGPNMAGKSTYMRQTALITIMAHLGSFVPAESANIPLTDKIFTRIGASDSLISDQSTFMVEMNETAYIINNATKNSLIILDEIGRGTSTFDGLSIAWAVVEYITKNIGAKTLFATHYHELTELEGAIDGIKNYKVTVKELQGEIVFMRKIIKGGANKSFGIEVAKLAGIRSEVTNRAKEILRKIENNNITTSTLENNKNIKELSKCEKIIKNTDVNNLTPVEAFNLILELSDIVKGENNE